MRFEVRDKPYDLYTVITASAILVLVILIFPDLDVVRIVLGLPFILFFPGYVLISALYPERKRYFDREGNEVPPPSEEEEEGEHSSREEEESKGKRDGGRAFSRGEGTSKEDHDISSRWPKGKGLDGLERVALSLSLSIAITPLIGLLLNYTYDWAPDTLGIRLIPILLSQFVFILLVGAIAIYKRSRVPPEDRFAIIMDLTIPGDYTTTDKILTLGIAVMMIMSVGMLVYIIVVPREGESFTEFYILGPNHKAEGYPRNVIIGEKSFLYIGIGNHEHQRMNYTLVMTVDPSAESRAVDSLDNATISRYVQPSMSVDVEEGSTREVQCNFSILDAGSYKLRFLLLREDEEYRDLHIWVRVLQEGYLGKMSNGPIEFYLAGAGGDPSLLPSHGTVNDAFRFSIGTRNMMESTVFVNVTFGLGDLPQMWICIEDDSIAHISPDSSFFMDITVNSTSSFGPKDVSISFPQGEWDLTVNFRTDLGSIELVHKVLVGGG
ncbi:MAG: DUF1616 domain-containing protein [Thermoplasmatota archaeon]